MITKREYQKAIKILKLGIKQLIPDGRCCIICGDTNHQAWECHHNPLSKTYHFYGKGSYWKCFHCREIFFDFEKAQEHFGKRETHGKG